ncbi:MAG: adenylyl-sulfate reductase subunit alpha [Bacillota bacterium]|nr:adenylyl-sulfate reductase subunit alpha [Bacillota bacterium]
MARGRVEIEADILIIGGGTAGCLAAYEARQVGGPDLKIVILEKAFIRNSGCLSAGMNALNMYLNQGTPADYVAYARYDSCGAPIREDILLEVAAHVNETVALMEAQGLPIKKRPDGRYLNRGKWNVEVNGSLLKPITASMAAMANAIVYNRVYVTDLITADGRVTGCIGFGVRDGRYYIARARAVLIAAGGCAGLWRPRGHGDAHHRIWYFPFNCGGSYALCKRAGAKMVGFEMRVVPLRTKDTYSPTGTLAIGMGAPLVNAAGEAFMREREEYLRLGGHNAPTPLRVLAFSRETEQHRGPVYFDTRLGDPKRVAGLKSQYLEMAPSIVLYWGAHDLDPRKEPVEVDVGDPNILGAHAASAGAWTIGTSHMTTVEGLFVSGDALGGAPSRFISGSWTCGRLAARNMVAYLEKNRPPFADLDPATLDSLEARVFAPLDRYGRCTFFTNGQPQEGVTPQEMEWRMQNVMEEYCGGRSRWYCVNATYLSLARKHINRLRREQLQYLVAKDLHDLQLAWDVVNRLDVCQMVIEHLDFRKETRLPGFVNRTDYPEPDDGGYDCFICSVWDSATDELIMSKEPYVQVVPGDRKKESV